MTICNLPRHEILPKIEQVIKSDTVMKGLISQKVKLLENSLTTWVQGSDLGEVVPKKEHSVEILLKGLDLMILSRRIHLALLVLEG